MKERGNITILLIGDANVGKSSLASTFVSRHFSEQVPGILTRVRLPPDPSLSKCTTTIIDTQEGDTILSNAFSFGGANRDSSASISSNADSFPSGGKPRASDLTGRASLREDGSQDMRGLSLTSFDKPQSASALKAAPSLRGVDAIILVFDLERIETFYRLTDHWLPLFEQCYNGELAVILAGNKVDLLSVSGPSRQQIISLLQRFKFVRQCIKCSAKKLINVDKVFRQSQESVLYPLYPLYDLNSGKLSAACSKAFTRIFRMFDTDKDGLLSDAELNKFHQNIWGVSLIEKDFTGWKKMVTDHHISGDNEAEEEDVILDGKFTVAGFLAMFDVLITRQNRIEVTWKVLRVLGYDNELNFDIPASISSQRENGLEFSHLHPDDWRLTRSDIDFLTSIFLQFDSDGDGTLSPTDIHSIFSVLSCPYPVWGERGDDLFGDCFSRPRIEDEETPPAFDPDIDSPPTSRRSSSIISASGITISSSPLPSVDISKDSDSLYLQATPQHKPLSFLSWMSRWHMICTISPSIARTEMYRLGHTFERKTARNYHNLSKVRTVASHIPPLIDMPSTFVRAVVLGSRRSGKRGLVQKLHQLHYSGEISGEAECPLTSCSVSKIMRPSSGSSTTRKFVETMVHVILTEVPALDIYSDDEKKNLRSRLDVLLGQERSGKRPYDVAVLAFDAKNMQSLEFVKELERNVLTDDMPRVFIGTTSESAEARPGASSGECEPIREAYEHCKSMELEPPHFVSLGEEAILDSSVLEHLVSCAQDERQVVVSFRSTPYGERKQRNAKMRRVLWIGGLVTAGITVVLGLTLTGKKKIVSAREERGGWLRFFQNILPF